MILREIIEKKIIQITEGGCAGWTVEGERWAEDPLFDNQPTPPDCWRFLDPEEHDTMWLARPGEWKEAV